MSKYASLSIYYDDDKLSGDKARCIEMLKTLGKRKATFIAWMMTIIEKEYGISDLSELSKEQLLSLTKMPSANINHNGYSDNDVVDILKALVSELATTKPVNNNPAAPSDYEEAEKPRKSTPIPTVKIGEPVIEDQYITPQETRNNNNNNNNNKYIQPDILEDEESDDSASQDQLNSFLNGLSEF